MGTTQHACTQVLESLLANDTSNTPNIDNNDLGTTSMGAPTLPCTTTTGQHEQEHVGQHEHGQHEHSQHAGQQHDQQQQQNKHIHSDTHHEYHRNNIETEDCDGGGHDEGACPHPLHGSPAMACAQEHSSALECCSTHASHAPPHDEQAGQWVGSAVREAVAAGGYRLVVTGHSLGAGVATLIAMKLRCVGGGACDCQCVTVDQVWNDYNMHIHHSIHHHRARFPSAYAVHAV